jgi:hypothetical protein
MELLIQDISNINQKYTNNVYVSKITYNLLKVNESNSYILINNYYFNIKIINDVEDKCIYINILQRQYLNISINENINILVI